jgi:hypothetical protein
MIAAMLEFLNGFDSALFLHCSRFIRNISGKSKNADQIDAAMIFAWSHFVNMPGRERSSAKSSSGASDFAIYELRLRPLAEAERSARRSKPSGIAAGAVILKKLQ